MIKYIRDRRFIVGTASISGMIFLTFASFSFFPYIGTNSGTTYSLSSSGYGDLDKTIHYDLNLQIITQPEMSGTIPISGNGMIVFSNDSYVTSNDWQGSIVTHNHFMTLWGSARDDKGHVIYTLLTGKLLNNTQDGSFLRIAGIFIKENQRVHFSNVIKMVGNHLEINKNLHLAANVTTTKSDPITLLSRQSEKVHVAYPYGFTTKVYRLKDNPRGNFDQHGGEVKGAQITSIIMNSDGNIVQSFNGMTNQFGYFQDGFRIPDNFTLGVYVNFIVAERDGVSTNSVLFFHVFPPVDSGGSHISSGGGGDCGGGDCGDGGGGD